MKKAAEVEKQKYPGKSNAKGKTLGKASQSDMNAKAGDMAFKRGGMVKGKSAKGKR